MIVERRRIGCAVGDGVSWVACVEFRPTEVVGSVAFVNERTLVVAGWDEGIDADLGREPNVIVLYVLQCLGSL